MTGLPRMIGWGLIIGRITSIIEHWESVKVRLLAIWEDLKTALPTVLGGGRGGLQSLRNGPAGNMLVNDIESTIRPYAQMFEGYLQSTRFGRALFASGILKTLAQTDAERTLAAPAVGKAGTQMPGISGVVVRLGNFMVNVIVNVAGSNASPQEIGEAAGSAVGSRIRASLSDFHSSTGGD